MTRNLLRVDETDVLCRMKVAGELGPQIGKSFAGQKRDHVHAKKWTHVHPTVESHSAGEQISTARRPTTIRDGAS